MRQSGRQLWPRERSWCQAAPARIRMSGLALLLSFCTVRTARSPGCVKCGRSMKCFPLRHARHRAKNPRHVLARRARPTGKNLHGWTEGLRLFHIRQTGRRAAERRFHRPGRVFHRLRSEADRYHGQLHAALKDRGAREVVRGFDLRPAIVLLSELRPLRSRPLDRCAGAMPAAGQDIGGRRHAGCRFDCRYGHDVNQHDLGEMLVNPSRRGVVIRRLMLTLAACILAMALSAHTAAFADANPFAGMRQPAPTGITGWILAEQSRFYRALSGLIHAAKTDGSALWALMGISFIYGIFHAAGPGHGKAVISSYLVANEETWRRAARRHGQDDGRYGPRHRDRELCADRAVGSATVVGQEQGLPAHLARHR